TDNARHRSPAHRWEPLTSGIMRLPFAFLPYFRNNDVEYTSFLNFYIAMLDLSNPQYISKLLEQHQLSTKKKFGQNFLINRSVLDKSLEIAQITQDDIVIEIGAGIGVLTRELAQKARKVIAFEVDQSLRPILDQTLGEFNNIDVHFEDFRQVNLNELLLTQLETSQVSPVKIPGVNDYLTSSYKVVANLPYNAGTHIIGQLLQLQHTPQSITVLLQKEVAQ